MKATVGIHDPCRKITANKLFPSQEKERILLLLKQIGSMTDPYIAISF